jgi:putative transposase
MGRSGTRRDWREQEALFRYSLVREAGDERLSPRERGALVRALAGRPVEHPSGGLRSPGRSTLDRWIRAYRQGGFEALKPAECCPGPRTPASMLDQAAALRLELPARTGGQIAEILARLHGDAAPSARTVERYLRARGLSRARLGGSERAYGRFEASAPNELWVADVLHGPLVGGRRAYLFLALDDHSRFVVAARFAFAETTLALEGVLRTGFLALGLPDCLYVDNGSPFASVQLQRICAVLGIRLVHSAPGRPQGRGKVERFFRTVRERFLVELDGREPGSLEELNRLFTAWVHQAYHRRVHTETGETPLARYTAQQPRRSDAGDDPELLRQAFLWREIRTVAKTATVSLHGNRYEVDDALVGCRIELLYDPFDLDRIEVRYQERPFGLAVPHTIARHTHPAAAREPTEHEPPPRTGIDYLRLLETEHEHHLRRQINYRDLEKETP